LADRYLTAVSRPLSDRC